MKSDNYGWKNGSKMKSQGYLMKYILKEIDYSNCVIDIGCGNGAIANDLISIGYDVYGIDGDREGIRIAQQFTKESRFFCMDIESDNLPDVLKDKHFDLAISTEVIEHLYSPDKMIRFAYRILDEDGTIVISTPYHGYLKNLLLSILGRWDNHFTALWEGGHIKFWSPKTLSQLLERNGFRVIKFYGCGRAPFLWKSMILVAVKSK